MTYRRLIRVEVEALSRFATSARVARERANLTIEEAAGQAHLTADIVRRLENAEQAASPTQMLDLADVLGISPSPIGEGLQKPFSLDWPMTWTLRAMLWDVPDRDWYPLELATAAALPPDILHEALDRLEVAEMVSRFDPSEQEPTDPNRLDYEPRRTFMLTVYGSEIAAHVAGLQ